VDDDNNLDIFQMTTENTEPTKELGKRLNFLVLFGGCERD
jgi:hypothetical protein